jgi:UDP-N-acetylglucosamine acyltransferase
MGAIVGHAPQDLAYKGAPTFTRIGDHNQIREYVTIHRGTKPESATVIGNENFIMAYCHIAHNCELGNQVILVNQASLTGYCIVEDQAFLSGMTGFHQFTRIGRLAMVSALSACNKDVPPFMICGGRPAVVLSINVVGLRRAGIAEPVRNEIKKAYKVLYRSGLAVSNALEKIKEELTSPEVQHLVGFIESSERGILAAGDESGDLLLPRKKPLIRASK